MLYLFITIDQKTIDSVIIKYVRPSLYTKIKLFKYFINLLTNYKRKYFPKYKIKI